MSRKHPITLDLSGAPIKDGAEDRVEIIDSMNVESLPNGTGITPRRGTAIYYRIEPDRQPLANMALVTHSQVPRNPANSRLFMITTQGESPTIQAFGINLNVEEDSIPELPTIELRAAPLTAWYAGTWNLILIRKGALETQATVNYRIAEWPDSLPGTTAEAGTDFNIADSSVTFDVNETVKAIPVTINTQPGLTPKFVGVYLSAGTPCNIEGGTLIGNENLIRVLHHARPVMLANQYSELNTTLPTGFVLSASFASGGTAMAHALKCGDPLETDPMISRLHGPFLLSERYAVTVTRGVTLGRVVVSWFDTWTEWDQAYTGGGTMQPTYPVAQVFVEMSEREFDSLRVLASGTEKLHFTTNFAIYTATPDFKFAKQCTLGRPKNETADWYSAPVISQYADLFEFHLGELKGAYAGLVRNDGLIFMVRREVDNDDIILTVYDAAGNLVDFNYSGVPFPDTTKHTLALCDSGDILICYNSGGNCKVFKWNLDLYAELDATALDEMGLGTKPVPQMLGTSPISLADVAEIANSLWRFNDSQQPQRISATFGNTNEMAVDDTLTNAGPVSNFEDAIVETGPADVLMMVSRETAGRYVLSVRDLTDAGTALDSVTIQDSTSEAHWSEDETVTCPATHDIGGYARRFLGVL